MADDTYGLRDEIYGLEDAAKTFQHALMPLTETTEKLGSAFSDLLADEVKKINQPAPEAGGGGGSGGGGMPDFSGLASGVTQAKDALMGIVSQASQFVSTFNPATVELLNSAFRDLQSVIGEALLPIVQVAVDVVRDFGAVLLPLVSQIQPLISTLANVIGGVLIEVFGQLISVITPLLPILGVLVDLVEITMSAFKAISAIITAVLVPIMQVIGGIFETLKPVLDFLVVAFDGFAQVISATAAIFQAAFTTLVNFLGGLFGKAADLKGPLDQMKSAFVELTKYVLSAAVSIAQLFGVTNFLGNLIKAFEGPTKKDARGHQAATGAGIKDFASIGKDIAEKAFTAQGTGSNSEPDWRADVLKTLQAMEGKDMVAPLKAIIYEATSAVVSAISRGVLDSAPVKGLDHYTQKLSGGLFGSKGWLARKLS